MRSSKALVMIALVGLASVSMPARSHPIAEAPDCHVFPPDNHWNLSIEDLPVHENSDAIIRSIGLDTGLHADFGAGQWEGARIGIPYVGVPGDQKKVPISFYYGDESDKGPYPIPKDVPIEGGRKSDGDRHVIVIDKAECTLYEVFNAHSRDGGTRWRGGSGAVWDLNSNKMRPKGWTSADAAGLPIFAGLARYHEVKHGEITHALRFTVSESRDDYIYPASHSASDKQSPDLPAMGQRVRLKKSFDISGFPEQVQVILRALKTYGMIVADNGSDWYISGAPNKNWNDDALHQLGEVVGGNLEVVDTSKLPKP
jgi:hypothetical protein